MHNIVRKETHDAYAWFHQREHGAARWSGSLIGLIVATISWPPPQAACGRSDTSADRIHAKPNIALTWTVIVPADGTSLPRDGNGDFGTSPFYRQQLRKRY